MQYCAGPEESFERLKVIGRTLGVEKKKYSAALSFMPFCGILLYQFARRRRKGLGLFIMVLSPPVAAASEEVDFLPRRINSDHQESEEK